MGFLPYFLSICLCVDSGVECACSCGRDGELCIRCLPSLASSSAISLPCNL